MWPHSSLLNCLPGYLNKVSPTPLMFKVCDHDVGYSWLWKETSVGSPWFRPQSQAEHLIKTTIGKDEDSVSTSSDRMGPAVHTAMTEEDEVLVEGSERTNLVPWLQSPALVCLLCGQGKQTALSVWTFLDNQDVEADKNMQWMLIVRKLWAVWLSVINGIIKPSCHRGLILFCCSICFLMGKNITNLSQ